MRSCPLCKEHESCTYMKSNAWNNRDGIELRKCSNCSFVFSGACLYEYGDFGSQLGTKSKSELLCMAKCQKLPSMLDEIISKSGLKSGNVLDFGAGIGLSLLYLQQKGFKPYAIETSKTFLNKHAEFNITSAGCFTSLNMPKESFDLIIIKDLLEHVEQPVEMLQEIAAYLKPSGYLYVRVPNVYHYPFHWAIDTISHINHFTPKKLQEILAQQHLKKIDFIGVYDVSTKVGKIYNSIFWRTRHFLPMYHQISFLCQKNN